MLSRKEKILELVIEDYINTAVPISSRAISRKLRKALSPATVRSVMADLEDAQLITHPHTSAGRIPTDKGYRHYVDTLMQTRLLTEQEKKRVSDTFKNKFEEIDNVIVKTTRLLSSIAEEVGLVTFPILEKGAFRHIELVELDSNRILAVLVTNSGLIKNMVVEFDEPLKKGDLGKIANFLNTRFDGVSLHEIKKAITQQLLLERDSFFYILDETKCVIDLMLNSIKGKRVYLEGASRIVMQPEFNNIDKVEGLLAALEDPDILDSIAQKSLDNDGVGVYIGEEIGIEPLNDCSLITCNYKIKKDRLGLLGIIGPKRMQYAKMVSLVDYMANILSEMLE
ncbi:MAG: heat-inducible transcriptional repressor HrcA [Candidatus Omnitrophota bacterium]